MLEAVIAGLVAPYGAVRRRSNLPSYGIRSLCCRLRQMPAPAEIGAILHRTKILMNSNTISPMMATHIRRHHLD